MKKILAVFMAFVTVLAVLCGCGGSAGQDAGREDAQEDGGKIRVVTTVFPLYDFTRQIAKDLADVSMLSGNGADLHNYQPSAEDIVKIAECDLFIFIGGESEEWAEDVLALNPREGRRVICVMDEMRDELALEETAEGMEAEDGEASYDEHVWLSLSSAQTICGLIADALAGMDGAHASFYQDNERGYAEQLAALDEEYRSAVEEASVRTLLFADRFPFRYLARDYGLEYYAAFSGCSAETEASFETIRFLAEKADELGLGTILQIEGSDGSIARTVRQNTRSADQQILTMDSLQSATAEEAAGGKTYLETMRANLEVLRLALS